MVDRKKTSEVLAHRLWATYGASDPQVTAARYRNLFAGHLIKYAKKESERILREINIPGSSAVLGGSLGYDTSIRGGFDIDLRILLPEGADGPEILQRVSNKVAIEIPFRHMIDPRECSGPIYHHGKTVAITDVPKPVDFTLNIQSNRSYFGLAHMAKRLPKLILDRYVTAKGLAAAKGANEDYKAVKRHWQEMLHWLDDRNFRKAADEEIEILLDQARPLFPVFLKPGRSG